MMTEIAPRVRARPGMETWLVGFARGRSGGNGGPAGPAPPGVGRRPAPLRLTAGSALPETFEDATGTAVFDGVLYNRNELVWTLCGQSPGTVPGDAELAFRAYRRWGEAAFRRLKGVFAVAIHDVEQDLVVAARDPLGVHPLFYADTGRSLLISTAIESLLGHPEVSRAVNRAAVADALSYRWPDAEETYFAAIRRVPPGHVLKAQDGRTAASRYWDPGSRDGSVAWAGPDEVERFDALLEEAVERCLALGPAAIFLSGGLDSVSIAAVAADLCRRRGQPPPLALSLAFPHPDCNEEPVQRSVARQLGLPHVVVPFGEAVGPAGLLREALERSRTLPAPLLNIWSPAYEHLAGEGAHRGARVILTGGGGDEWLTVSPYYAADLLAQLDLAGVYRLWSNMRRSYSGSLLLLHNVVWRFGIRALAGELARRALLRVAPGLVHARWRRHVPRTTPRWVAPDPGLRQTLVRRHEASLEGPRPRSLYLRWARQALEFSIVSAEKEEIFEIGRRQGFLERMPYWDADLVDLLYRVPVEILNRGGRSKGLVRESVARRFPSLGFERQRKVSATEFYRSIMAAEGPALWSDLGGVRALSDLGVVDPAELAPFAEAVLSGRRSVESHRLWEVMKLEAWVRPRV